MKAVTTPGGPTDEDLGRRLVALAADAGVKVFIYSTCESPGELTNGKAPVPGMDGMYLLPRSVMNCHSQALFARSISLQLYADKDLK